MLLSVPTQQTAEAQTADFTTLSALCKGSIKVTVCSFGHVEVRTESSQPWFSINGLEEWADERGFTINNRNFTVDEEGDVEALLQKRLLVPKSCLTLESHCPAQDHQVKCKAAARAEARVIISLPRTIIFYISQKDNSLYNPSSAIYFPSTIIIRHSTTELEYRLDAKVYSTHADGIHFNAKVLHQYGNCYGVYEYDDLKRSGKASLLSENPRDLSGKEELVVMAFYNMISSEETYMKYSHERTGIFS